MNTAPGLKFYRELWNWVQIFLTSTRREVCPNFFNFCPVRILCTFKSQESRKNHDSWYFILLNFITFERRQNLKIWDMLPSVLVWRLYVSNLKEIGEKINQVAPLRNENLRIFLFCSFLPKTSKTQKIALIFLNKIVLYSKCF